MALPYLEARLGSYCSYCGMKLDNAPEVEHVASKSTDPALITNWDNLLLACKACNPRKSNTVTSINKNEYLWPDQDNTALAFCYPLGVPQMTVFADEPDILLALIHAFPGTEAAFYDAEGHPKMLLTKPVPATPV